MRGTPFVFEGFQAGLNTIDSPYTLEQGETRSCMNVVSTSRGAIKKRTGSTVFASGTSSTFPELSATEEFKSADENPFAKVGWGTFSGGPVGKGKILSKHWVLSSPVSQGAMYETTKQANPAVSIEIVKLPEAAASTVQIRACWTKTAKSGYVAYFTEETAKGEKFEVTLERQTAEAPEAELLKLYEVPMAAKVFVGLAVREGVVSVWKKPSGGSWEKLGEASDSTYTEGYSGFIAGSTKVQLNNFTLGEMPAATNEAEIVGIAPVTTSGGTFLIATASTNVYSINSSGVMTSIGSGFTSGLKWSVVQAEKGTGKTAGPVYLSNGTDAPQYWTGAAKNTALAEWKSDTAEKEEEKYIETPKAKYLLWANNRMWAAGISSDTSAVRFTELISAAAGGATGDPTEWAEDNVVRFDPEDGEPITGIGKVGPYILVFKKHKTWVIYDLDTGENRKISNNIGCVSHRSIVETENGTYFLTADQGVYLTNGSNLTELSYKVRPTILGITGGTAENAAGGYLNNHYYLSFATEGSTKANRTLDYDVSLKSWWLHDLVANQWAKWEPAGVPAIYLAKPVEKGGVVQGFVENVYTDSGATYTGDGTLGAWWIGPWDPYGYYVFRHKVTAAFLKKRMRQLFFNGSGEIIPLVYRDFIAGGSQEPAVLNAGEQSRPILPVNFSEGQTIFANEDEEQLFAGEVYKGVEMIFGGSQETGAARIYAPGIGFVWSIGWGNNTAEPFEVDAYMTAMTFRKS